MRALVFAVSACAFTFACSSESSSGPSRTPPITGQPTAPGAVDGGTVADGGCFDGGTPGSASEFLNQCTGNCFPFDNTARIQGYTGGPLPPLN